MIRRFIIHNFKVRALYNIESLYLDETNLLAPYISGEKNKDETELEKLKSNPYLILPPNYSPSGTFLS